jgi:hypothetical protein
MCRRGARGGGGYGQRSGQSSILAEWIWPIFLWASDTEMTPPRIWMGFSRATLTRALLCSLFSRNVTVLHAPPRERADRS